MRSQAIPRGQLRYKILRAPGPGLSWKLRNNLTNRYILGWIGYHLSPFLSSLFGITILRSKLGVRVVRKDGSVINYGIVGFHMVTTVGVTAMANSFITPASPGTFYFHGLGTGGGAEAVGNTTLTTEMTTGYSPDNTRPTGTHVGGESAWIYETVATITISDVTVAATEHGIFSQAAVGGGSLLDKTLFTVVNLGIGDSFVATYNLTFTAGG